MRDFVPDDFLPEPDALRDETGEDAPKGERIPDDLVDAFFDDELDEEASRAFMRELREDHATARDVVSTNSALEALRRPVSTPDFTGSIIDRVHGKTPWLSGRQFAILGQWRLAAAACVLLLMTGAFIVQRMAPGAVSFTQREAPVSQLAETLPGATSDIAQTVNVSLDAAQRMVSERATSDTSPSTFCFNSFSQEYFASIAGCDMPSTGSTRIESHGEWKAGCENACGIVRPRGDDLRDGANVFNVVHTLDRASSDGGTSIIK
jgi:hypothetical protein